jgi:replicative DNA helicase
MGLKDLKLERMVLAAMISNPSLCEYGIDNLREDSFSDHELKKAFDAVSDVWSEKGRVDLVSFFAKYEPSYLFSHKTIAQEGQALFFDHEFQQAVDRLDELKKCRDIARLSEEAMKLAMSGKFSESVKVGTDAFFGVEIEDDKAKIVTQEEHADKMIELIENGANSGRAGIYTKFKKMNQMINGGFDAGDLIILAAPTGHGKTNLAMNFMESFAMVQKVPTLYVNTEMSESQINARLITIISQSKGVTYSKIMTNTLSDGGKALAKKSAELVRKSEFKSITVPNLDIKTTEVILRRYKSKFGIRVAVIDYAGRMDTQDKKLQEWQVLYQIAKKLKTIAQKLDMTIFMVAQMTKEGFLQGSKAMENEATVCIILDRPKEAEANIDPTGRIGKKLAKYREMGSDGALIISKNRIGAEGRILIRFNENQLRFEEVDDGYSR